jgi:hypothetical protein
MLIHQGFDAIAKYLGMKIGDDKWNFENESFEQSRNKERTSTVSTSPWSIITRSV